jgi:hypothetical protein
VAWSTSGTFLHRARPRQPPEVCLISRDRG